MRSKSRSIKVPHAISDAGENRARALGYTSLNAYIVGLMRYDLVVRRSHHLMLPIARMRIEDQDKIDDRLLDMQDRSSEEQEAFFNELVQELIGLGASLERCPVCQIPR